MSAVDLRPVPGGCLLRLRVAAGASPEGCAGTHDGALKLRVAAAPERGKANRAVLALLAGLLDLPVRRLALVKGETARDKWVRIEGAEPDALRGELERILSAREGPR